jgi:hypothetical protein
MIRLLNGNRAVYRAIEVSVGVFKVIPDTICTIGNERERCHRGVQKLGIDVGI